MKQNDFHPFLHGKEAGGFSINITPSKIAGTLKSSHVSVGAGMVHPAPPRLPAGVGAELTGVVVTILVL